MTSQYVKLFIYFFKYWKQYIQCYLSLLILHNLDTFLEIIIKCKIQFLNFNLKC